MTTQPVPTYEEFVMRLSKAGADVIRDLTPESAHAWHMATGVSGEAGELLDAVKKHAIYARPIDRENVVEELGDLKFYITGLMVGFGITDAEVEAHNRAKLGTRYASLSYSNEEATVRADKATALPEPAPGTYPVFWINGRLFDQTSRTTLTYEDVVTMAGMSGKPTVTYFSRTDSERKGGIAPGHHIGNPDGLVFDCVHTDRA